ncbi:3-hydroxyacyl-CoA dehydrogenase [Seohaeicola saemankumensis]|nr:3-hydroxyacyl-CoA dehydrogenase [Seohaeicola saemankumensis]MCA0871636.1 3-hydroxyacyl-CoA dehydrogenase [Seohaeicola saemankumensis]
MTDAGRLLALREIAGSDTHLAQAVRRAAQGPAGGRDPATLVRVGVLGAGTMGRGIALGFARSGRQVVLVDPSATQRRAALADLRQQAERAAPGTADPEQVMTRIRIAPRPDAFRGCDLVVEAVPEVLNLKHQVLDQIEAIAGPDAIVASNTSTLDIDVMAGALTRPDRFIGTHFFLPAHTNPLLEVIPARTTADDTLATVMALARDLGKRPVIAPNGDGFIGNRLFDRFHQEAMYLVEEGAWPEEVDCALEDWGMTIGPFRALDMVGNDIPWGVRRQRALRDAPPPQPRIGDALCEAGWHGRKAGRGWYLYDRATPRGRPYEDLLALIRRESRALGRVRRRIGADEIVARCLTALMVEAMALLAEGRAARASDIDVVYVTGYGFPAALGGPMHMARHLGPDRVLALARHFGALSSRADTAWRLPDTLVSPRQAAQ